MSRKGTKSKECDSYCKMFLIYSFENIILINKSYKINIRTQIKYKRKTINTIDLSLKIILIPITFLSINNTSTLFSMSIALRFF